MRLLVLPHAKVVGWPLTSESIRKGYTEADAEHHQCLELGDAAATMAAAAAWDAIGKEALAASAPAVTRAAEGGAP